MRQYLWWVVLLIWLGVSLYLFLSEDHSVGEMAGPNVFEEPL